VLSLVDCCVLVAEVAKSPSYEPVGVGSLIVILLAIAAVRHMRRADDLFPAERDDASSRFWSLV